MGPASHEGEEPLLPLQSTYPISTVDDFGGRNFEFIDTYQKEIEYQTNKEDCSNNFCIF